jgi:hypothetical protein
MTRTPPRAFFAYPSAPATVPETLTAAAKLINQTGRVRIQTWQDGRVGGKLIIGEICAAIDDCELLLADLTGLNPNVLFEVGYAIARKKRLWLTLDTTLGTSDFTEFRTLSTIGYASYINSSDVANAFAKDAPETDLKATLWDSVILQGFATRPPTFLYLKSQHDTDASVELSKRVSLLRTRVVMDDPNEAPYQGLAWYGQHVVSSDAVLCHLTNPARQGARVRNARYALVAGLAFGVGKPVLLLCEGDYMAPLDYREMTRTYATAAAAGRHLSAWLPSIEARWTARTDATGGQKHSSRLATELRSLDLGEYIAENEGEDLVGGYFVETTAYLDALAGTHAIFVGRKGAGKSANFLQLASTLGSDPRNVLSVIKPIAYEMQGVVRLLGAFTKRDRKTFVVEGLWKFLLYSEVAASLRAKLEAKPLQARSAAENGFLDFCFSHRPTLAGDFSSRLEKVIAELESEAGELAATDGEEYRQSVATTLHSELIRELREIIVGTLPRGARVAVIIDNLDKAWDKQTDLVALAEFLLGLLGAAGKIRHELADDLPQSIVSLAVFLRADIFDKVQEVAREPDKIQYARLTWKDPELLCKLVEERFAAAEGPNAAPESLWDGFFCSVVRGQETKRYLADSVLPRPRDFIYVTKAAVSIAVNRGHSRVEEDDVLEACRAYSQFAMEILVIEDNSQEGRLEKVLYEFAGGKAIVDYAEIGTLVIAAGLGPLDHDTILSQLCALSFLGVEVQDDDFRFPESATELKKTTVLARNLCSRRGAPPRYLVHRAFRPFLEIDEC